MALVSSDYYWHTATAGDTWDTIAYSAYLQERLASLIIKANPRLCHMIVFEGGEKIKVPIVSTVETPLTLPPWRRR